MYDARQIANFVLDYADAKGVPVTLMALLKLLYFAHGWYLAQHDAPLIKNRFEAWRHGPVIRAVYEEFQSEKGRPIRGRATILNPISAERFIAPTGFPSEVEDFIKNIFDAYGYLHAFRLSDLTHEQGSPWSELWNLKDWSSHPGMIITNDKIRAHFLERHALQVKQ